MVRKGEIPKVFESEDTIYHYCDLNTAIEYILHDKKLRLSYRKNAIDPIESILPWFSFSRTTSTSTNYDDIKGISNEGEEIRRRTIDKISKAKQLSFCTNKDRKEFQGVTILPEEYYGFLKPRMWDQYANEYKGVCLAFSLKALKRKARKYIHGPVEYESYRNLKQNHYSIDETRIEQIGIKKYWSEYSMRIEKTMFIKHMDYETENEYKFVSFSDNEFDYLDIKDCLRGVIMSSPFTSEFMTKVLNKYSKEHKTELLHLKWSANGINYTTQKEMDKFYRTIRKILTAAKLT